MPQAPLPVPAASWGPLGVFHATHELVASHAPQLAAWYNHPPNKDLLSNTQDLGVQDVEETFASMRLAGGHPFLLFEQDALVGDADLRGITSQEAEFAIMVGDPARQGRGLGTRFGIMVHAWAFEVLGLQRFYLSFVSHNTGARRSYLKLGYLEDVSHAARAYAEDPSDVAMRLDRARFEALFQADMPLIRLAR